MTLTCIIRRDAAQNPLTFQEKKSLISKIHQLPASKMQQVVDIIQDAIPPEKRGEGDEIEIPLDELDTFTLRKLQSFVEVSPSTMRPLPSFNLFIIAVISSSIGTNHPMSYCALQEHNAKKKPNASSKEGALSVKKPRKDKAPVASGRPLISAPKRLPESTSSSALLASQYGSGERISSTHPEAGRRDSDMMDPLGDSIEEDDLFFSNESFDDLRAQAAENGTSDASGPPNTFPTARDSIAGKRIIFLCLFCLFFSSFLPQTMKSLCQGLPHCTVLPTVRMKQDR
jgi:Bromodomain extra-terminal - transcription regulation